jgi:hypothetical protein
MWLLERNQNKIPFAMLASLLLWNTHVPSPQRVCWTNRSRHRNDKNVSRGRDDAEAGLCSRFDKQRISTTAIFSTRLYCTQVDDILTAWYGNRYHMLSTLCILDWPIQCKPCMWLLERNQNKFPLPCLHLCCCGLCLWPPHNAAPDPTEARIHSSKKRNYNQSIGPS